MKNKLLLIPILLVGIFYFFTSSVQAATLKFSPSSNSYDVGNTFISNIHVSSPGESLNAASGVVSFPKDKLEVVSISKLGSVFNFWVTEPNFSNILGTINFEGLVLNPGFIGQSGQILTITFKVKSAGSAQLNFQSGSVLANDGQGTNILTGLGKAEFNLRKIVDAGSSLAVDGVSEELVTAVNPPTISYYPSELRRGKTLIIRGQTYENSKVNVWFQHGSETTSQSVSSNHLGEFTFIGERKFDAGVYKFWATATTFIGLQSAPSEQFTVLVRPSVSESVASWLIEVLIVFIPVAVLVLILVFIVLFAWYKLKLWKNKLKKEVGDVEEELHSVFSFLKKDASDTKTKNNLSKSEQSIEKEITDVNKQLN